MVNKDLSKTKRETWKLIKDAQNANDYRFVVKGYYMLAFVSMLEENSNGCFIYANKALKISQDYHYKEGQALALRVIGTQYARMNVLQMAMKHFDEALASVDKVNSEEAYEIEGLIYNSKLVAIGDSKEPKELKEKLKLSLLVVESYNKLSHKDVRDNLLISAYTNVGYNYIENGQIDSARIYFDKALYLVSDDNIYMLSAINHDLGYMYLQIKDYNTAKSYFEKALKYLKDEDSAYLSKKIEILKNLGVVYEKLGDRLAYLETEVKLAKLVEDKSKSDVKVLEKELQRRDDNFERNDKRKNLWKIVASSGVILALIVVVGGIRIQRVNDRKYKLLREKFESLKNQESNVFYSENTRDEDEFEIIENSGNDKDVEESPVILQTVERLLHQLEEFEDELGFLQPNFTVSHLAIQLETNTKTLSQIIKNNKNLNFNAYINQLRIIHFLKKVEEDEEFRKYKLAYISEYLGYSSPSAFSKSFKAITGLLPSTYLKKFQN